VADFVFNLLSFGVTPYTVTHRNITTIQLMSVIQSISPTLKTSKKQVTFFIHI